MKVTIIVGGRWHSFDLAKELYKKGYLHRLITTYPKFKTRDWGIPDEKVISLPLTLLFEKLLFKLTKSQYLLRRLQHLLLRIFSFNASFYLEGSDIIHGWSGFSYDSLKWAKKKNIPFVLERGSSHTIFQDDLLHKEHKSLKINYLGSNKKVMKKELFEYEQSDMIQIPSLFVKKSFLSQAFPKEKLFLNNFGANLKQFSLGKKLDNNFRVIYAGSLSIRKGIIYLLKAFKDSEIFNSELIILGSADKNISKVINQSIPNVKFYGHVPQKKLINYYRNSDVFVMPSIEEGMAMVQLQAMACGLPLICTTNTGGEDLLQLTGKSQKLSNSIKEFPGGYLVNSGDSNAIKFCLKKLANDQNLLESKKKETLKIREKYLGWENYASRTIDLYRMLSNDN